MQSVQEQLAEQRRYNESLGYVPGPRQVDIPRQFGYKINTIPASSILTVNQPGDYFYLLNAIDSNGEPMNSSTTGLKDNNGNVFPLDQIQKGYSFLKPFDYLEIINQGTLPLTIQYCVGSGRIEQQSADIRTSPIAGYSSVAFQRPNDVLAYSANQVVSTAAASMPLVFTPLGLFTGNAGQIIRAKLIISLTTNVTNANFSLWLFNANPGNFADKATFAPALVDLTALQGIINFPAQVTGGVGSGGTVCTLDGLQTRFRTLTNRTLWGQLVANAAYTPVANSNFRIELHTEDFLPSVVSSTVTIQS